MKLSVIVPVHNTAKYLRKSVGSITGQTYRNLEIILVENASTDASYAICQELAAEDARIRVLHLDKGDPSYARNEGVKAAEGEYVGFVDSDDTIEPEMYADMLEVVSRENLDILFCDFMKKYDYRSNRHVSENTGKVTVCKAEDMLKWNFMDRITQSACTLVCRKSLFDNVKFPIGRYYEDTATTWKLILAAEKTGHIAKPYYHYYRHEGSIVHTASFRIHYGHVLADMERIDYINACPAYSYQEKLKLGEKPLSLFYRHFRRMVSLARTGEEKRICQECRDWALALPNGYELRNRYSRTMTMVRSYWRLFCLLRRGSVL